MGAVRYSGKQSANQNIVITTEVCVIILAITLITTVIFSKLKR